MSGMVPIKIICHCGQKYAFDVQPEDGRMPVTVNCPVCGRDGTIAANESIRKMLHGKTQPLPPPSVTAVLQAAQFSIEAHLVEALKDAVAYCGKAYDGMTDKAALDTVKFFGRDQAKLTLLAFNTAHTMEHYGNMVTYLRLKGLVPPSSEPRK